MKRKTIANGLVGLILATAPIQFESCSKNTYPQKDLAISGTEYKNHESNSNYKIEMQRPLGKIETGSETYIYANNLDEDNGELNFVIYKEDEAEVVVGGPKTHIKGEEYIPTRAGKNGKVCKEFEIHGIDAKIISKLEKRINKESKKSESDFGYNYYLTSEDIKEILPSTTINGQEYLYWKLNNGKLTNEDGEKATLGNGMTNLVFMPLNDLCDEDGIGINLKNKNLTLYRECGFYIGFKKELQKDVTYENCDVVETETEKTKLDKPLPDKSPLADKGGRKYIVIGKGETAWGKWGKDYKSLEKFNPGIDFDKIQAGQKIYLE